MLWVSTVRWPPACAGPCIFFSGARPEPRTAVFARDLAGGACRGTAVERASLFARNVGDAAVADANLRRPHELGPGVRRPVGPVLSRGAPELDPVGGDR